VHRKLHQRRGPVAIRQRQLLVPRRDNWAAHAGDAGARHALREYAEYLAAGIASIVHLLDPELLIVAGGIAQENKILLADLDELLPRMLMAAKIRRLRILASQLGYYGAVYGARAIGRALLAEKMRDER
jgi:glucokinase